MTKYAIFICTRIIVRIMPTGTSLYGLDYNSMQQYIRDIVHRARGRLAAFSALR